jgi:hypothetical protein
MFPITKIALATALMLGAASAALANDIETNPSTAQSVREWNEYQSQSHKHNYGSPAQHDDDFQSAKRNRNH